MRRRKCIGHKFFTNGIKCIIYSFYKLSSNPIFSYKERFLSVSLCFAFFGKAEKMKTNHKNKNRNLKWNWHKYCYSEWKQNKCCFSFCIFWYAFYFLTHIATFHSLRNVAFTFYGLSINHLTQECPNQQPKSHDRST